MNRRTLFAALTSVAVLSLGAGAMAQTPDDYPNRPIRIIVPQAAGSGVDQQARVLAQKMSELWGQQGVVENRPGANAIVGMEAGAKAAPDGYTLIYAPVSAVTMNNFIYKKLSYDPLRDFVPITQTVANPLGVVVNPASGIKSIKDIVERAKANPGELNYGSFGIGNMTHLMGVLLSIAADIKMTHVPYRGQTPAITDVLSGQIPLAFTTTAGVTDLAESGKLTLLATFGKERDEQFPNTPTPTEAGYPKAVVVGWAGLRGAVSLAAALALPAVFPERNLILLLTFGVIVVTLVGQGLTLPIVIRRVGWDGAEPDGDEPTFARAAAYRAGLDEVERARPDWPTHQPLFDRLESGLRDRGGHLATEDPSETEERRQERSEHEEIQRAVIAAQRQAVIELRDRGEITDRTLRIVERELDLEELRMEG